MAKFDLKKAILENKATFFSSLTEGQFSWMTQDTGQQIGSMEENQIPVYMFDDKGKYYYENDYDGYGVFGGKDYYDLVAEMNGYTADNAEEFGGMFNDLRGIGIKLAFDELETKNENGDILFPALVTRPNFNWKSHDFTQEPKNDPNQSWYEPEKEDEEDEDNYDYSNDYDENNKDEYIDDNDSEYDTGVDEGKKKYYKDSKADDAEHIKALEKDMKDDKKSGKMKMSELTTKIREMVLAEMESNNMEDAPENEIEPVEESNFLAELEGMLDDEEEFSVTLLVPTVYFNPETGELAETSAAFGADSELEDMGITNYSDGDELSEWVFDNDIEKAKYFEKEYPGLFKVEGMLSKEDSETISKEEAKEYAESWEDDDILNDFNKTFNNQEKVTKPEFVNFFEDYIDDMSEIKYIQAAWRKLSSGEGLYEAENSLNENAPTKDTIQKKYNEMFGKNPQTTFADVAKALNTTEQDIVLSLFSAPGRPMFEAKKDEEEVTDDVTDGEETVDVTDDFSMEEPQGPGKIDVTQNANADLTGTKKDVQDNLEAALEAARTLGDKKLATQVGNTITFFNKQHVVKDTPVAEGLNESMFPMLKKILK